MKRLQQAVVIAFLLVGFSAAPVEAQGVWGACDGNSGSAVCADKTEAPSLIKRIVNILLFVLGAVAVIMIIHSGLKFVIARGDPANVKNAKDTLLYAVIGLVVAASAFTIVNFVVGAFNGSDSTNNSGRTGGRNSGGSNDVIQP